MTRPGLGALIALCLAGSLYLIVAGLRPLDPHRPPTTRAPRTRGRLPITRRDTIVIAAATAAGVLLGALTTWYLLIAILPIAAWGLPKALGRPDTTTIDQLEGLDQWTRRLAGLVEAGSPLHQALITTLRSAPEAIRPPLTALVTRLRMGQPIPVALYRFADDINDPVGDKIAAALIRAATVTEGGVAPILHSVAVMVGEEVHSRRQATSAQSAPRTTARAVTAITTLLVVALVFFTDYGTIYKSTIGQIFLLAFTLAYGACLWWFHRIATPRTTTRFLVPPANIGTPR